MSSDYIEVPRCIVWRLFQHHTLYILPTTFFFNIHWNFKIRVQIIMPTVIAEKGENYSLWMLQVTRHLVCALSGSAEFKVWAYRHGESHARAICHWLHQVLCVSPGNVTKARSRGSTLNHALYLHLSTVATAGLCDRQHIPTFLFCARVSCSQLHLCFKTLNIVQEKQQADRRISVWNEPLASLHVYYQLFRLLLVEWKLPSRSLCHLCA